ncbi:MBOAT, membrane-bound O-acyltransferase family-domain-containing protein [Hysterangium stoloniferum]|nr:MBOAT, membrane-bound O-acyltransferase family-domain-containing protein [Hysterangium stoloniferum]
MSGEVRISMPTDLRDANRPTPLQLEPEENLATSFSESWRKRGITSLSIETPTRSQFSPEIAVSKSRWKTPEYILYAVVLCPVFLLMIRVPIQLSDSSHPNFHLFAGRLTPGWIPGRLADNSDAQYRSFRNGLVPLTSLATVFLASSRIYDQVTRRSSNASSIPFSSNLRRVPFLAVFSIVMLFFLHGFSAIKVVFIITINFIIGILACSPSSPQYLGPFLTWIFNGAVLFINEIHGGYTFTQLHPSLRILDTVRGFYPGWHVTFNITMLRLVSFNMDYYWASRSDQRENSMMPLTSKQRPRTYHSIHFYNITNYIAYVLYPPLYIGGPIMTFNDFLWQVRNLPFALRSSTFAYALRFLFSLLTMEFILHYMYVVAIKNSSAWQNDSPMELSMIGFWNLIVVWLKLLLPWRFFRLWALLDGIDPPENMVRCMANNYSTVGFWRSWHRSYNLWLLRYIYIPIGGARQALLSTLLVFTFVALWHDLSFRLLTWGWLVSLFIIPELAARWYFPPEKFGDRWWYRHICAMGGVFNILLMMSANLIGFVLGVEGMQYMVRTMFDSWQGIQFLCLACTCLFVGVQVMFEYRQEERRKGVHRRY